MLRYMILLSFAFLISANAWAQRTSRGLGFDVNDATVLFPLDLNDRPVPFISLSQKPGEASLLSPSLFSELMVRATEDWIAAPAGVSILKQEPWTLMAFRYDPCAPANERGDASCVRELRLVAQPQGNFGPTDSALHLVYKLGEGLPDARDPVLSDLLTLKRKGEELMRMSNAGQPLGVHPILKAASEQNRTDVPLLYETFIRKYAVNSKLHKLTMMGLRDGSPIDWIFLGGNIVNGRWIQQDIPNLASPKKSTVELNLGGTAEVFSPVTIDNTVSTEDFFNSNPAGVNGSIDLLNTAVHTLENPHLTNRNTVDCLSCHTATSVRMDNNFRFLPHVEGVTADVPTRITAFPAPFMLGTHPTHWNLRALGYFSIQPTITVRTVHEAAQVAVQINEILGLEAPGRDCSLVVKAVMSCFVTTSAMFGTGATSEQCLKSCKL